MFFSSFDGGEEREHPPLYSLLGPSFALFSASRSLLRLVISLSGQREAEREGENVPKKRGKADDCFHRSDDVMALLLLTSSQ